MKKKTIRALFLIALAISIVLSGCNFGKSNQGENPQSSTGDAKEEPKQVLNISARSDISTLDSAQVSDDFTVMNNINEGLYRLDQHNQPIEGMASEHTVSEDGLTHTFTIRDAKWSNGEPVTANDFEYAWKRVFKENGYYTSMFVKAGILHAGRIVNGEMNPEDLGVKAVDGKTLEVRLENPTPLLKLLLTFVAFFPQNQKFVEAAGKQYGLEYDKVLSNGPFMLTDWKHEQGWQYKKNPNYWNAKEVKLEEINAFIVKDPSTGINLFETGKLDRVIIAEAFVDSYRNKEDFMSYSEPRTVFLRFNNDHPVFKNKHIRRAFGMAFNREGLTNAILNNGSEPLYGVVPKGVYFSPDNQDFRQRNGDFLKGTVEDARQDWQKGLDEIGQKELEASMLVDDMADMKKTAEYLKDQLERNLPGLTLNIKVVPFQQRRQLEVERNYQFSLSTWGPDYSDPMAHLDIFATGSPSNRMNYSNPKYDELVKQASFETDLKKRFDMMLQLEQIFLGEDAAIAPVFQRGECVLQRKKIKGLVKHSSGPEFTFMWTTIE